MNFEALLSTALSLFLFILIGFVLYKAGVVDTDLTKKLSGFVAKAAQPFLIIWSVVKLEYSPENLKNGMIVLGFSVLLHIFLALAAKLFSRAQQTRTSGRSMNSAVYSPTARLSDFRSLTRFSAKRDFSTAPFTSSSTISQFGATASSSWRAEDRT